MTGPTTNFQDQQDKGQGRSVISRFSIKLENVSIAKALQLEAAQRRAVPIRFYFVARAKFEVAAPIRYRLTAFFLLICYVML